MVETFVYVSYLMLFFVFIIHLSSNIQYLVSVIENAEGWRCATPDKCDCVQIFIDFFNILSQLFIYHQISNI